MNKVYNQQMLAVQVIVSLDLYHITYMAKATIISYTYCWGSIYGLNPERFIESNTENSWLSYLNNMCIQGTWADALIIQAVADALEVTIQIVESNEDLHHLPLFTQFRKEILLIHSNFKTNKNLIQNTLIDITL